MIKNYDLGYWYPHQALINKKKTRICMIYFLAPVDSRGPVELLTNK